MDELLILVLAILMGGFIGVMVGWCYVHKASIKSLKEDLSELEDEFKSLKNRIFFSKASEPAIVTKPAIPTSFQS